MAEVKKGSVSRRDFIKGTGLAVGGVAISSSVLAVACKPVAEPTGANVTVAEFVCPYDSQKFSTMAALQAHVASAHAAAPPPAQGYPCPYDTQTFTSMALLQAHIASAHPVAAPSAQTFPCPYDTQTFATMALLQAHMASAHPIQAAAASELTKFTLNGHPIALKLKDWWTLNYVIREVLMMTGGTKISCDEGICGMCTIIMNGKPILSCMVLGVECEGKSITTIEGLGDPKTGALSPVQQGFVNESGFMCGFCTTGNIMAATAYLDKNPNPTRDDVRLALSNNLCLCGGYELIQLSVLNGAKLKRGG